MLIITKTSIGSFSFILMMINNYVFGCDDIDGNWNDDRAALK